MKATLLPDEITKLDPKNVARATCMVAFADVAVSLDERTTEQCARLLKP